MTRFTIQFLAICLLLLGAVDAQGEYFRQKESDIDPNVFRIKEADFMGVRFDPKVEIIDENGGTLKMGDLGGKALILVWSYYTCDGSCSAINQELKLLLQEVEESQVIGRDFRVLTLSFDKEDTLETLKEFRKQLVLPQGWEEGWTFGLLKEPEQVEELTGKMGFKFFWAPQDKTFYHPNVFIFLSPEGRVTRYLYSLTNSEKDMKLAILEARKGEFKVNEVIDFVVGLCYSYNYKEGRYTYNIPLFVGLGALFVGISLLTGSLLFFKRKYNKEGA
ncbi:MAG: SCO family protein [Magnetococcales bacterium]|nr:SCO family protein [Magnetococcales bacterium]